MSAARRWFVAGADRPPVLCGCLEACRRLGAASRIAESAGEAALRACLPHLRHALEHVMGVLEGASLGTVDHAARRRDPVLESDPVAFRAALAATMRALRRLSPDDLAAPLVAMDVVSPCGARGRMGSTLEREIAFVASHAVHHLAIVTARLEAAGIEMPAELCLNYSTATHRREQGS